jgi:hypothetical protein
MSIVPFFNINEETYSESTGNTSNLLAEEWVKNVMGGKDIKADEI